MLYHSYHTFPTGNGYTDSIRIFPDGYLGVEFFFLVSGALLLLSAQKARQNVQSIDAGMLGKATAGFMQKKISRIFSVYWAAYLFGFFCKHIVQTNKGSTVLTDLIYSVWDWLLLSNVKITGAIGWVGGNWYISAMLLGMLFLYPLALRYKEMFVVVLAPIFFILFLGHYSQEYGNLAVSDEWNGLVKDGTFRAIGVMSLGCISYACSQELKKLNFSERGEFCLAILEVTLFLSVLVLLHNHSRDKADFIILLLLFLLVTLLFSEKSGLNRFYGKFNFLWCRKFTLCLYLTHISVCDVVNRYFPPVGPELRLIGYIVFSILTAALFSCIVPRLNKSIIKQAQKILLR